MRIIFKIIIYLFSLFLCGCVSSLQIKLNSTQHLNPDVENRSLPVEIVVYQLQDDQIFRHATFQQLWQDDRATLGSSLLSRREITVIPGAHSKVHIEQNKHAHYLGVIAVFRNPKDNYWRAIKKLGLKIPMISQTIVINLHKDKVNIEN